MNIALLTSAFLGVATAAAHSWLSETKILRPLFAEEANRMSEGAQSKRVLAPPAMRRLMRAVWHLPSLGWAATGVLTYGFVHHGTTPPVWFVVYGVVIYAGAGLANAWALRSLHPGNVLLPLAAALLVAGSR